MTPLPVNPVVVVLVDENSDPVGIATNVAPDLEVKIVRSQTAFNKASLGKPFVTGADEPVKS
jgi:hypothetical protein